MPTDGRRSTGRRRWADVVIIIASAYALSAATWVPSEWVSGGDVPGAGAPATEWLWAAYMIGGVLGFASLFISLERPTVARVVAAVGGLAVLGGFFVLRGRAVPALVSLGVTGVALLVAGVFMRGAPAPDQDQAPDQGQTQGPRTRPTS